MLKTYKAKVALLLVALLISACIGLVLLARSPHGGCPLTWKAEDEVFHDPCFGSEFAIDGTHILSPAQRNLDQLPSSVRDDVIWVRN